MKKRAFVVFICAICFVASLVAAGFLGLSSTGAMHRLHSRPAPRLISHVSVTMNMS